MSLGKEALDEIAADAFGCPEPKSLYGRVLCNIIHTTEAAFNLKVGTQFFWCPKSQVASMVPTKMAGVWEAHIKIWVLDQSGIPYEEHLE